MLNLQLGAAERRLSANLKILRFSPRYKKYLLEGALSIFVQTDFTGKTVFLSFGLDESFTRLGYLKKLHSKRVEKM
jgi:hypothetical protein